MNAFDKISVDHVLFKYLHIRIDNIVSILSEIWCRMQHDQEIICHRSLKIKYFQFQIWQNGEASEILPAMKWPVHQMQERIFREYQKQDLITYLYVLHENSAIVIKSWEGGIKVRSSLTPTVKLSKSLLDKKMIWGKRVLEYKTSDDWCLWKPHTILVDSDWWKELILNNSYSIPFKKSIEKLFIINNNIIIRDDEGYDIWLLKLSEFYNLSPIIYYTSSFKHVFHDNEVLVSLKSDILTVVNGMNIYTMRSNSNSFFFQGTMFSHPLNESIDWLIFKLAYVQNEETSVTKETKDYRLEDDLLEKIDDLRSDDDCAYTVVKKADINSIEIFGFEHLKYFSNADNLNLFKLDFGYRFVNQNRNISNINLLPKYISPTFSIDFSEYMILHDQEFWKWSLRFEKINILYDCRKYKITPVKESIDDEDIFTSLIEVENNKKISTSSIDSFVGSIMLSLTSSLVRRSP